MLNIPNNFLTVNPKVQEAITSVKIRKAYETKLTESDYKIIKCYEYSLVGLELPYDIEALHAEREAIREEIRALDEAPVEE